METFLSRAVDHMIGRITGPLRFRLILQPGLATFLAVRAGLRHHFLISLSASTGDCLDLAHHPELLVRTCAHVSRYYLHLHTQLGF